MLFNYRMRPSLVLIALLATAAMLAGCVHNERTTARPAIAPLTAGVASAKATPKKRAHKLPDQALVKRQPSSQCELSKPLEGVPPDQARAAMLDYEQQCYKQRAELEHVRLIALQDAAARRRSFGARHQALLERQPPPRCEPSKPSAGLSPAEAREATLDAQRQCYKQLEANERHKLEALQSATRKTVKVVHVRNHAARNRHIRQQTFLTY